MDVSTPVFFTRSKKFGHRSQFESLMDWLADARERIEPFSILQQDPSVLNDLGGRRVYDDLFSGTLVSPTQLWEEGSRSAK